MNGPGGWTPQVSAAYDETLNPQDDVELTDEEREIAETIISESAYNALKDFGTV